MGTAIYGPTVDQLLGATDTGTPGVTVTPGEDSSGSDSSGFLSGLGDLFQGIGAGIGSGLAGSSIPKTSVPTGWSYNPTTGLYYDSTGRAVTSTGTVSSVGGLAGLTGGSNIVLVLVVGLLAILFLRRRREE